MINKYFFFSCCYVALAMGNAYAWDHEIAMGYGYGKEVEQSYDNQGVVLSGKIYKIGKVDDTLIASIDGTLANMYSSYYENKHMIAAAASLAMRAYFANPDLHAIRPYLQASFGPTYLSRKELGNRTQGSHFAFLTTLEIGTEIKQIDLNLRMMHICNAGLFHPNEGINLTPVLSIGYLF